MWGNAGSNSTCMMSWSDFPVSYQWVCLHAHHYADNYQKSAHHIGLHARKLPLQDFEVTSQYDVPSVQNSVPKYQEMC